MSLDRLRAAGSRLVSSSVPSRCAICRCCPPSAGPSRPVSTASTLHRNPKRRSPRLDEATSRSTSDRFIPPRARAAPSLSVRDFTPRPPPSPARIARVIMDRIPEWTSSRHTRESLATYGLPSREIGALLDKWKKEVTKRLAGLKDESATAALEGDGWDVPRLQDAIHAEDFGAPFEGSLLRHFLSYSLSYSALPPLVHERIRSILSSTDLRRLPFQDVNLQARSMTRHFHLHIGPTNSGKTYNALKALSKASTGAYAGPLRLLAHEVWERLNLGSVGDLNGKGRPCNLITGEERRIVSEDAGLSSCTVEMLPLSGPPGGEGYDVVVIDEIQMLGDSQRGGAWTSAVLGVKSKEVHLCGDETTVELLRPLIKSLGDEMTIHRYDRLTPLRVGAESLDGDFGKAEAGDCFVTFSRTNIFTVKRMIEQTAGKKCAVVYGALPPETRAEQAKDFNEGRAEVLVASDAVGMGLNLLHKFNGKEDVPLALTQIKQIAGRAGRYGMHKAANSSTPTGGEVTTLHPTDLPVLESLLPLPLPSIPRAVLDIPFRTLAELSALLPPNTTYAELLSHIAHLVALPPHTTLVSMDHKTPLADLIEPYRDYLDLTECELFGFSPVNHRDARQVSIFIEVLRAYSQEGCVRAEETLEGSGLLGTLQVVERTLSSLPPLHSSAGRKASIPPVLITAIPLLETLHKALVLYIWLSFRLPLAFPDRQHAVDLKERTEYALEECLKLLPGLKHKRAPKMSKVPDDLKGRSRQLSPNTSPVGRVKAIEWEDQLGNAGRTSAVAAGAA